MIEKLKKLIGKIPYGLIPMAVVGVLIVICSIITFFVYYKTPISMNDAKDRADIVSMVTNQHPNCDVINVKLVDGSVVYPETLDSLYVKSAQINDEDDAFWYTRAVDYDVVSGVDTVSYQTIFEIEEKFLRNEVGQFLFKVNKEDRTITY